MKFNTIIIGGGLAGMTSAIRLAESGEKVAVVSAGRSALLFNTGTFGLMGFDADHRPTADWSQALSSLPAAHPYSKIGSDKISALAQDALSLLKRSGLNFYCSEAQNNHGRISPLGIFRPAWLSLEGLLTENSLADLRQRRVALIGLAGFLDFYPRFIAASLRKASCETDIFMVDTPDLRTLRSSETEMRAANIARILHGYPLKRFAEEIKKLDIPSESVIVLPAVIDPSELEVFRSLVRRQVLFAPTLGVSLPGVYIHDALIRRFKSLGGRILNGHRVNGAQFGDNRLIGVTTDKLDDDCLYADSFVFAGGSFFSHGLLAHPDAIVEPVLGLDTDAPQDRNGWFEADLFGAQPVMKSGVATNESFNAKRNGSVIKNLYVVGSALSGADSVREESGAGVAMISAIAVADTIIKNK